MEINHKQNFLATFSYDKVKRNRENLGFNIIKGLAYLPIVGAITQLFFVVCVASTDDESNDAKALLAAFSGRVALSLVCPFILPVIDTVGSIWRAVDERKQT